MRFDIIKMQFLRPIHLSKGKMDTYESSEDVIHSDTLKAALYATALKLYNQNTADDFQEKIFISSAFPYTEEEGFWLPKPLSFQIDGDPNYRKNLKGIKYLKLEHFEKIINGEIIDQEEIREGKQPDIWKSETTQRVVLDRVSLRGVPFYLEKKYPKGMIIKKSVPYHADRGLYMIVYKKDEDFDKLPNLIQLLGDTGIGLQRSLGNGIFKFKIEEKAFSISIPSVAKNWISLSLFLPAKEDIESEEILFEHSSYQLIKRGGWIASPSDPNYASLRKKSIMMISEGSAITFKNEEDGNKILIKGRLENLRPKWNDKSLHNIWRDGRSLFIPSIF